ncbi:hypothetical protein BC828DRAFT_378694 [Blastocladiella britannica]|nr:hypothetical protein BC828DRAFT_378694 [Blastocladiella britannica]
MSSLQQQQRRRPWSKRPASDLVYFVYFGSHIVFTLVMDAPTLLAASGMVPSALLAPVREYVKLTSDPLMGAALVGAAEATWFRAFLACELGLQLPVFFVAARRLYHDTVDDRTKSLLAMYGAHVATAMVPILATIVTSRAIPSTTKRLVLIGAYLPYFALPAHMAWRYALKSALFGGVPSTSAIKDPRQIE